jgi:two-component system, cell cycle sensor histidine kinase and response regulator CckA
MRTPDNGTTKTILLVENDPLLLKCLRFLLEKGGFTVLSAGSAEQAMRTEAEFSGKIHLLLVSVTMPIMSGAEIATKLEGRRPGLPIMLMSGYPDGGILAANNGWHFISKPFGATAILKRIRACATAE